MNEVALAGLFAAAGGVLTAVVNVLGARLNRQIPTGTDEAKRLRDGIRRHINRCKSPSDLVDLLLPGSDG
jgi:hypothetical protein